MFIPVDHLKPVLADLLTEGKRAGKERPWFGIWSSESEEGISVLYVAPDSPAHKAGLRKGDLITSVEGQAVAGQADFYRRIWAADVAGGIKLQIRRDGAELHAKLAGISRDAWFRKAEAK
jgi:S1-C subfamily serine protease